MVIKHICTFLSSDPLPRCVHLAYKARKASLTDPNCTPYSCVQICNKAGELLRESLAMATVTQGYRITKVRSVWLQNELIYTVL